MKKRTLIIVVALLALLLTVPAPAFAYEPWDVEDPEVASRGDFIWGQGWDGGYPDGTLESYYGEQSWSYYPTPDDGYNLYRDDATDTGNLDAIQSIITRTPDAIDLPGAIVQYFDMDGGFYYITSISSDTWYWATEPRGYNLPTSDAYDRYKGLSGVFWVEVLNYSGFNAYKWDDWSSVDRVLRDDVIAFNKSNGLICTLYIPEGTHLSYPGRPSTLVTNLSVEKDDSGGVYFEPGNMDFSQECVLAYVTDGVEEVITFTQIRDGLPVPMVEVAPASSVASPAWIYGT